MNFQTIVKPMLLEEEDYPFDSKEYLYELKFDGIRALIYASPKEFHIYNRKGREITESYPELKSIQSFVNDEVVFDGEIILISNGKPNFLKLQERSHLKDKRKIKWQSEHNSVCFIAFDLLYMNKSLLNVGLLKRKKMLDKFSDTLEFIKSKYVLEKGVLLFKSVKKKNLEGIVAKKIDSMYVVNSRSKDWVKIKNYRKEEFYIGAYELLEDKGLVKLYLGEFRDNKLEFVGKVVITSKSRVAKLIIKEKERKRSPFTTYSFNMVHYIKNFKDLKCIVSYMERTRLNHLRQPIFIKMK